MKAKKNKSKIPMGIIFFISLFTIVSCNNATQYDVQKTSDVEATDVSPAKLQTCPPFCDFSVTVDGDNFLYYTNGDTYTADISGGDSPYSYLWNYTLMDCHGGDCSGEGVRQYGSSSSSFHFTNNYGNFGKVRIEVWIDDDNNDEGYASKTVTLSEIQQ